MIDAIVRTRQSSPAFSRWVVGRRRGPLAVGHAGRAAGLSEGGLVTVVELDGPAPGVEERVVPATQEDAVGDGGVAAVFSGGSGRHRSPWRTRFRPVFVRRDDVRA